MLPSFAFLLVFDDAVAAAGEVPVELDQPDRIGELGQQVEAGVERAVRRAVATAATEAPDAPPEHGIASQQQDARAARGPQRDEHPQRQGDAPEPGAAALARAVALRAGA